MIQAKRRQERNSDDQQGLTQLPDLLENLGLEIDGMVNQLGSDEFRNLTGAQSKLVFFGLNLFVLEFNM